LVLEYLENEYYSIGLSTPGLIPNGDRTVFMQISKHESAHVAFKSTLTSLGTTPETNLLSILQPRKFSPFTDYNQFLILAQALKIPGKSL
jgi:hypothetical protein